MKVTGWLYSARLLLLGWFLRHALILEPNDINYSCHIKSCKTCLANHMGFMSCHITLLVINRLGEGTSTCSTQTDFMDESNFKKPGAH